MSFCCSLEAEVGYEAVRECRSVHVERPSCSTSGGHSEDVLEVVVVVGVAEARTAPAATLLEAAEAFLAIVRQDAAEVQRRHL